MRPEARVVVWSGLSVLSNITSDAQSQSDLFNADTRKATHRAGPTSKPITAARFWLLKCVHGDRRQMALVLRRTGRRWWSAYRPVKSLYRIEPIVAANRPCMGGARA